MLVLHAAFPIAPERREEALEMIEDLAEQSRTEEGTIDYRATTDVEDANVVRIFEHYEDEAAFEAHEQTDHFRDFESQLPDLLDGEPEVVRFEVEAATELDL